MTSASTSPEVSANGLSSASAAELLQQFGPNALPEEPAHPMRQFLSRLWAPVPWMLEVTIVLELVLRRRLEAIVIAILLLLNALLSLVQERKAENALALLRKRLPVKARVLRDGAWQQIDATQIVPGDRIYVRMGDIVPADLRITQGQLSIDQSMLTGESLPVDAGAGGVAYAGAIVRRGEAGGEVTATGARTYFGKTANLVNSAQTVSHLQTIIFRIVQYLIALDGVLVAALLIFALYVHLPLRDMLPFALILLVASVPVALQLLFANDFVTMAIATDNVGYSPAPDHWDIRPLMMTAGVLATCLLLFSAGVFLSARHWLALPLGQLQTLDFLMLVFTGQATVYLVRERRHFWQSRPGKLLIASSLLDVAIVILLAINGVLMPRIAILPVVELLAGTILFMVLLDAIKIRIFQRFGIR